jgi:hypothetical protein
MKERRKENIRDERKTQNTPDDERKQTYKV